MKWIMSLIIIGLVALAGCSNEYQQPIKPLVEIEPNCNEWTICTSPIKTVYNISGTDDCMFRLDPGQAQDFFDHLIRYDIKVSFMSCTEHIKEFKPAPVAKIVVE